MGTSINTDLLAATIAEAVTTALVAHLGTETPARTKAAPKKAAKKAPAQKAAPKKPAERTSRVVKNGGQKRLLTFEGGRIVSNEPYGKKAKKRAAEKAAQAEAKGQALSSKSRKAYIAAAMKQDEEYLEAIAEHFGFTGRNPSTREVAFYALDVELEVPGFHIGEGYRSLFAEQA